MTIKLNLANTETQSNDFKPLPKGTYNATVFEVAIQHTKATPKSKMPDGTPYLAVQFKINDPEYDNRRVWGNYMIPPEDYENKEIQNRILFGFFEAIGYKEEDIRKWRKLPDMSDLAGRPCRVRLVISKDDEERNEVKGVRPPEKESVQSSGGLL